MTLFWPIMPIAAKFSWSCGTLLNFVFGVFKEKPMCLWYNRSLIGKKRSLSVSSSLGFLGFGAQLEKVNPKSPKTRRLGKLPKSIIKKKKKSYDFFEASLRTFEVFLEIAILQLEKYHWKYLENFEPFVKRSSSPVNLKKKILGLLTHGKCLYILELLVAFVAYSWDTYTFLS